MSEEVLNLQDSTKSTENPYAVAGWLSITMAILYPLGFFIGFLQNAAMGMRSPQMVMGPSDLIMTTFTIIGIYVLIRFRTFLNERYSYHGINTLITFTIIWSVAIQIFSLVFRGLLTMGVLGIPNSKESAISFVLSFGLFIAVSMISIGIIDLNIAIRLLRSKEKLSNMLHIFAYITLIAGICEISLFLVPISLLLVPVTCVIIGIILIRDREPVEFV